MDWFIENVIFSSKDLLRGRKRVKILFICMNPLAFNSSGTMRNIGFIKGTLELGHIVDTITLEADDNSIHFDDSSQIKLNIANQYIIKQNYIYRKFRSKKKKEDSQITGRKESLKKNSLRETINKLLKEIFLFDLQIINIKNVKLIRKYDLVVSSSDPKSSHILAEHIIKKNHLKCPWYQYWGDPMQADITNTGNSQLKMYRQKRAEARILKKAARVIYTSPLTLQQQKELYPDSADKMIYVTQACVKQEQKSVFTHNRHTTIGYFGDYLKQTRDITALISSIDMFESLQLIIAGVGDVHSDNPNITFYPRLSYEKLDRLEQNVDILVGICNKRGGQIPAKFYYMAGTQKPIILIVDGEHTEYLESYFNRYNRYIVCRNTPKQISDAIQVAIKQIQEETKYCLPKEFLPVYVAKKILSKEGTNNG